MYWACVWYINIINNLHDPRHRVEKHKVVSFFYGGVGYSIWTIVYMTQHILFQAVSIYYGER